MKKVFITGGAGFIGSHTVDQAIAAGYEVTVFDKKSWEEAVNLHHLQNSIKYVSGNICNKLLLHESMQGHTHVIHLAAVVSVQDTIENPILSHDVNVTGSLNVFESARVHGVNRVVYASSAAVYGFHDGVVSETTPTIPVSPYGVQKLITDQYAKLYTDLYACSILGLRYFNVYGSRQGAASPYSGVISIFTTQAVAGKTITIYGDGLSSRDYVSVYDVATANLLALDSSAHGVINIASGQETNLTDLVSIISSVIGKPITTVYLPPRVGDIKRSATYTDVAKSKLDFVAKVKLSEGLRELL